jgi:hypothetical protein
MMSRCFTWFPISGLGKPKLYHNLEDFTRMWGVLLGGLSNCEELEGILLGGCLKVKIYWGLLGGVGEIIQVSLTL